MVRTVEELDEILEAITKKVFVANRMEELDSLLEKLGLSEFIESSSPMVDEHTKLGKIVVIGEAAVKEEVIYGVCKSLGIRKERLELCLEYAHTQKFNYKKMQYASNYSVVLFGPVPHSTRGKGDSESIIAEIERQNGYPPVIRLEASNELKITKNNFKKALCDALTRGFICQDYC